MADKVNMSLDEIIRASKARRAGEASGGRNKVVKKQGARLSTGRGRAAGRPGGMRADFTKKIVKKAVIQQRNAARRNANANSGMVPRSEVKSIVNKAVKAAIKQSNSNIGIVGRLGGKIPRNIITASKLAQLSGRSRTIQRNRALPVMRQRGRGFAPTQPVQYVEEVVSPQPVRIIRQPVQAPVVQVVERIVPARQQNRKFGRGAIARQQQIARVGGGGRIVRQAPVIVRQQAQRVIQRPAQRVIQQQRVIQRPAQRIVRQPQQVIYERPAQQRVQVIRQAPAQRVQVVRRQAPAQRVQVIRQAAPAPRGNRQNVQYVEYTSAPSAARNKNNRMRDALGLSNTRHVIREAQRFEPSSSFLADRTVSNVRGRGFAGRRNAW